MILSCKQKIVVTTEIMQSQLKHWVFCKKLKMVSNKLTFYDDHWLNVFLISQLINSEIYIISGIHFTRNYWMLILMSLGNKTLKNV